MNCEKLFNYVEKIQARIFFHGWFNPIPAGVLENQYTLGGGQFDPPSKSHV